MNPTYIYLAAILPVAAALILAPVLKLQQSRHRAAASSHRRHRKAGKKGHRTYRGS